MLHLRIQRGPERQEYITIPDRDLPFTIGRDRENRLRVTSTAVSRFHAVLSSDAGEYFIQDMDSTNGTLLNGKAIKRERISPGDKVTIADVDIVVENSPAMLNDASLPLDLTVTIDRPIQSADTVLVTNPTGDLSLTGPSQGTVDEDTSRSNTALRVLYRADEALRDIEDYRQLLENFMDLIWEVMPASHGYILLVDRESEKLVPYVRRSPDAANMDTEIVVSRTILQAAVENKESILSRDALVDERFSDARSLVDMKVRSAMCAPLIARGKVLGIIYLDSTDPSHLFTKSDLSLLSAMALKAGIALDNSRLYDDLRNLFFNTVETLVRAIQARDQYTSGHSARVSRYCLLIGERMGLNTRERHHLYLTSMLHDIGKIGVPDELLNRPGKLTEHELSKVRDHVRLGAGMLKALGEMHPIVPLILHHHEAWNGSGYPDGLKGEDIPLISRIVAVADTYDAITSDRPYRKARSRQEAIAELRRCAGKNYDPAVVDAFINVLDEHSTAVLEIEQGAPT